MKAFVLAGGEGTRLRPYTHKTPKPMLPVDGRPILWYVLSNLKKNGFTDITITVGYLHDQIMSYFKDGKEMGLNIEYAIEEEALNTAGSILSYKGKVDGTFAVVMGDHLTDVDLKKMLASHRKSGAIATVALADHKTALEYGVVDVKGGSVTGFAEKPVLVHNINTAIYILEPRIFDFIKEREDFAKDVFPRLLKKKERINAYHVKGTWHDIGRVSDYDKLKDTEEGKRLVASLKL